MTPSKSQGFQTLANKVWEEWRRTAPERLDSYVKIGSDPDVLYPIARYLWNQALCEAISPALHTFEITVRNAVHWSMSKETGRDDWYESPGLLLHNEMTRVDEAKAYIRERASERDAKCEPDDFVTPGRVLAELTLGFWCALFSQPYEATIVHPVLARGMKNIPPEQKKRGRHYVAERMKITRDLRNRVFHHEAIYHLNELRHEHEMLLTFAGWLYPNFALMCRQGNRFDQVYRSGIEPYHHRVTALVHQLLDNQSKVS